MATRKTQGRLSVIGLAERIGTVIAVSVYTHRGKNRQWTVTFQDNTLRIHYPDRRTGNAVPAGYGATLDRAMREFAGFIRGARIVRDGRELSDPGCEWRVPKTLRAWS